jgi:RNase H-like domain found in reverse transcriptase
MLAHPDFNKPFEIPHTDASHYQLGAVISQAGKPIAFYSCKLNPAQTCYTTTERELLSIIETLKEYQNILLGHQIKVFTNHKNLIYKTFNTKRVIRWHLIIKEFGPQLTYIKRVNNMVADALSRMQMTEKDFGPEVFAGEKVKQRFPLFYKLLAKMQAKDQKLQKRLQSKDQTTYVYKMFRHSNKEYQLVTQDDRIVIPKSLERKATKWQRVHCRGLCSSQQQIGIKRKLIITGI